jgi:hypothetical protein
MQAMSRLTSDFQGPAALFLLRNHKALFATTSDQPLSAQALDMVRRVVADDPSLFAALNLPADRRPPAAIKAWSTAAEFLAKCDLRSWVVRCNDVQRFAPSTSLLLDHWQTRRASLHEQAQTNTHAVNQLNHPRQAACRWHRNGACGGDAYAVRMHFAKANCYRKRLSNQKKRQSHTKKDTF